MVVANRQKFVPVSHQQMEDVEEYRENWETNGYWTLAIPFMAVAFVILVIAIIVVF